MTDSRKPEAQRVPEKADDVAGGCHSTKGKGVHGGGQASSRLPKRQAIKTKRYIGIS